MKFKGLFFIVLSISLWGFAAVGHDTLAQVSPAPITPPTPYYQFPAQQQRFPNIASAPGDLLANGDMDDPNHRFYWRPTNHYVAGMWYEWWIGDVIPEFLDGGVPYHNICYPVPPDGKCYNKPYYNLSQGYILYNMNRYTAGVYQIVNDLTPCTLYSLTAYNSNEGAGYTSKVGLEPTGWSLPIPSWANPPDNCPPTGSSKCPDPRIDSEASFPTTMVWSDVSYLKEWHALNVTAEAVNPTMTAWLYAAVPAGQISQSSYWDYASLVKTPFPDNRLPAPNSWEPSGFIQNLTTQWLLDKVKITWTTPEPASTQVWYTINPEANATTYAAMTPADTTPTTYHEVIIEGLTASGDVLSFAALSRRPQSTACTTEARTETFVTPERVPAPASRIPAKAIQNISIITGTDRIQLTWETTLSTTTQAWYAVIPAPAPRPSSTLMLGNTIYLPLAIHTNFNLPAHTPLSVIPKTQHSAVITDLQEGETVSLAIVASYVNENQTITTLVSKIYNVGPFQGARQKLVTFRERSLPQ
ncbi:MAG TPA: hypothetical protein PKH77_26545 [Anaerolineae bacterium]|nr:hypothetical protein [Anaerolineae bacterium]